MTRQPHPADRRALLVALTRTGRTMAAGLERGYERMTETLLAGFASATWPLKRVAGRWRARSTATNRRQAAADAAPRRNRDHRLEHWPVRVGVIGTGFGRVSSPLPLRPSRAARSSRWCRPTRGRWRPCAAGPTSTSSRCTRRRTCTHPTSASRWRTTTMSSATSRSAWRWLRPRRCSPRPSRPVSSIC